MTENPRIKKRSLKAKSAASANVLKPAEVPAAARQLAQDAPPLTREEATPARPDEPVTEEEITAAVKITEKPAPEARKASQPHFASTARPSNPNTTSPHGTRPATLYYSSGPRKDKEEPPASPMKTTPSPAPTSSAAAPTTASARPAATAATSIRPATVSDYRSNIDRQAKEQKSAGGILAIIVYVLIGFVVLGGGLAGYGIYAITKQLHQQSLTMEDLDARYAAKYDSLSTQLKTTSDSLVQAQAQLAREQELIVKQQETINKMIAADAATASALRLERQARSDDVAALRSRVRSLENKSSNNQR